MKTFVAEGSMFEGLYVKLLKPTGAFASDLAAAGFDLAKPLPEYPMAVWVACLDVTARHLFPGVPHDDAYVRLGERLIDGFLQTLVGKLVGIALTMTTPRKFIIRGPSFIRLGIKTVEASVTWAGPTEAIIRMDGPHDGAGHVLAGVVGSCLCKLRVTPAITVKHEGVASELRVAWAEAR